jgi:4-aminobutyrate aminotransferase/(S)-3-amino-2-methylpropionate transaminase
MTTNQELFERRTAAVARGVGVMHNIATERAENAEIWDSEGNRYIDFAGGIAVLNTGHRHPKVVAAVEAQLARFTHSCFQVTPYEPYVALAEKLNALAPGEFAKKTILMSTGAEAVENSIKIARAATGRSGVIAFSGAFHGRSIMAMGLTGKVVPYKAGFGPFPGDVFHAPFPNPLHGVSVADALKGIEHIFKSEIEASRVAAMIIEPVQGEGGFYVAPFEFLQALRKICDEHGILLIADEVQTGAARTGSFFAIEQSGVVPDLITLAKSFAGGFPLSAVVGRAEVMDAPPPGGLGGTYAGNPLACAAALAVIEAIEQEGLLARSRALGERLRARFEEMAGKYEAIGDVRGLGAMVAIELFEDAQRSAPNPELTKALIGRALEKGLILLSCGLYGNVVRVLMPLTASDAIVEEGLDIIDACFAELTAIPSAA